MQAPRKETCMARYGLNRANGPENRGSAFVNTIMAPQAQSSPSRLVVGGLELFLFGQDESNRQARADAVVFLLHGRGGSGFDMVDRS